MTTPLPATRQQPDYENNRKLHRIHVLANTIRCNPWNNSNTIRSLVSELELATSLSLRGYLCLWNTISAHCICESEISFLDTQGTVLGLICCLFGVRMHPI